MESINYASAHGTVHISGKRFEPSPYTDKYKREGMVFGIYCRRFYPLSLGDDPIEQYWKLKRGVMLFDVPEKPLDIRGPGAVALLERVFCRPIGNLPLWRARYAIACTPQGGVLMDGVLIRLADDHFLYVQADGEFESWLHAHSDGLEVEISDPKSRALQIQGPRALDVLKIATAGQVPDDFGYFHAGKFDFGGQRLLVSRTGWSGEMGFEVYSEAATDHEALWDHLMVSGESFDMRFSAAESMGIRRLEAGILDYGTDIDHTMTPFEAGVGAFVDLEKPDFVGRDALSQADQSLLIYGLSCEEVAPLASLQVFDGNEVVGHMTAGAWTPYLEKGIGFVRFIEKGDWLGRQLKLCTPDGKLHDCEIVSLPFYDPDKKIPRGLALDC
jgi:glycine cleavage system aminomethyltransferase T